MDLCPIIVEMDVLGEPCRLKSPAWGMGLGLMSRAVLLHYYLPELEVLCILFVFTSVKMAPTTNNTGHPAVTHETAAVVDVLPAGNNDSSTKKTVSRLRTAVLSSKPKGFGPHRPSSSSTTSVTPPTTIPTPTPTNHHHALGVQPPDPRTLEELHHERSYLLYELQKQGLRATRLFQRYAAIESRLAAAGVAKPAAVGVPVTATGTAKPAVAGGQISAGPGVDPANPATPLQVPTAPADIKRCKKEASLVRAKIAESNKQEQLILHRLGEIHVELQNRERWFFVVHARQQQQHQHQQQHEHQYQHLRSFSAPASAIQFVSPPVYPSFSLPPSFLGGYGPVPEAPSMPLHPVGRFDGPDMSRGEGYHMGDSYGFGEASNIGVTLNTATDGVTEQASSVTEEPAVSPCTTTSITTIPERPETPESPEIATLSRAASAPASFSTTSVLSPLSPCFTPGAPTYYATAGAEDEWSQGSKHSTPSSSPSSSSASGTAPSVSGSVSVTERGTTVTERTEGSFVEGGLGGEEDREEMGAGEVREVLEGGEGGKGTPGAKGVTWSGEVQDQDQQCQEPSNDKAGVTLVQPIQDNKQKEEEEEEEEGQEKESEKKETATPHRIDPIPAQSSPELSRRDEPNNTCTTSTNNNNTPSNPNTPDENSSVAWGSDTGGGPRCSSSNSNRSSTPRWREKLRRVSLFLPYSLRGREKRMSLPYRKNLWSLSRGSSVHSVVG